MHNWIRLPKLQPGDRVAVVSPSAGLPERYPHVQDRGLARLRTRFGLHPVEYPTTRRMHAPLHARAHDLMAAFADPTIRAVFASIGGDDQIHLLPYLDPTVFLRSPKPFFGYSDNTHLQSYLWLRGIPSYYGGSIMTQFAMRPRMHAMTVRSLRLALFHTQEVDLERSATFSDVDLDWEAPEPPAQARTPEANEGWYWDEPGDEPGNRAGSRAGDEPGSRAGNGAGNRAGEIEGVLWGGCLESIDEQLHAGVALPSAEMLAGCVLFLETSELLPDAAFVRRVLAGLGERGLLTPLRAVLMGRPKAWSFDHPQPPEQRARYRADQRQAVLESVRAYNPGAPIVQNLDIGHTDPQVLLPNGGRVRLLSGRRAIRVQL